MHPTQRKLMKRIILFLSLQFPITYPAIAGQDIDLVANVKNSTCKSGISNQGNIDLGVVGGDIFQIMLLLKAINQVEKSSLSQYQTVHYRELAMCLISYILILEPLAVSWLQVQGKYLPMKSQPGLKMSVSFSFSIQDPTNIFNVISSAGNSRSVYPVMTSALHNSSWKFYARMQKIDPALDVISGQVMSHILVDVYYE